MNRASNAPPAFPLTLSDLQKIYGVPEDAKSQRSSQGGSRQIIKEEEKERNGLFVVCVVILRLSDRRKANGRQVRGQ